MADFWIQLQSVLMLAIAIFFLAASMAFVVFVASWWGLGKQLDERGFKVIQNDKSNPKNGHR